MKYPETFLLPVLGAADHFLTVYAASQREPETNGDAASAEPPA